MLRYRIVFLISPLFFLFSCLAPPADVKTELHSSFIKRMLSEFNKDNESMPLLMDKYEGIIAFKKGSGIFLESYAPSKNKDAIISSIDNLNLIINQSVYVTNDKKELLFSFDGEKWFSSSQKDGVERKVVFDTRQSGNSITMKYSMALLPSEKLKPVRTKFNKEIVNLKKGMVFVDDDKSKINCNLDEVILYIPKDTILNLNFSIDGNLLKSIATGNQIKIEALRDIYFYIKKKSYSLSFNKNDWTTNLLGFEISNYMNFQSVTDKEILVTFDTMAFYDKDVVSSSLIELLLKKF